jgi:hypothetical protein
MGGTSHFLLHSFQSILRRERSADELAGAILDEVPTEGSGLKFKGSAMVALASSKEEVLEQLKADIYAKNEVWDFSKVSLLSFYFTFVVWKWEADERTDPDLSFQVCFQTSCRDLGSGVNGSGDECINGHPSSSMSKIF